MFCGGTNTAPLLRRLQLRHSRLDDAADADEAVEKSRRADVAGFHGLGKCGCAASTLEAGLQGYSACLAVAVVAGASFGCSQIGPGDDELSASPPPSVTAPPTTPAASASPTGATQPSGFQPPGLEPAAPTRRGKATSSSGTNRPEESAFDQLVGGRPVRRVSFDGHADHRMDGIMGRWVVAEIWLRKPTPSPLVGSARARWRPRSFSPKQTATSTGEQRLPAWPRSMAALSCGREQTRAMSRRVKRCPTRTTVWGSTCSRR